MNKPTIVIVVALILPIAGYNVYSFFAEQQRLKTQQEAQRIEAIWLPVCRTFL